MNGSEIHWFWDWVILSVSSGIVIAIWGIYLNRNFPRTPEEQFREDCYQMRAISKKKRVA